MKSKIQIGIAILVIVGVSYWAYTSLQTYAYTGSGIMFPVGGGHVVIRNTGDDAIPIEMRAESRTTIFRVASAELGLAESARRVGSGRDAYYAVKFDLPPGQARIDVTRGNGIQLITRSDTPVEATITPLAANTIRWILGLTAVAIVGSLYYISKALDHSWLSALRGKSVKGGLPATASR